MASRSALEGERKPVTVLFADLRGSLSVIEGVDPEEVQALLDAVLAAMVDAVHRFEGAVSQTMGDGILALFGAPLAHEDHALRACCAALAMQDAVHRMQDESWKARGAQPVIRVGLHSGEVAVRAVHNDLSMEYRAVGSTTHIASRMEQLAPPGGVWLTEQTLRLCRGLLRTRAIGPVQVKGVQAPIDAFELVGISTRTRFQANALRGLSPLVGRESTLALLSDALGRALAGQPAAAILSGEPGIGKSRLCYELLHRASDRCRVLEASAASYGQLTPHAVLASLVRGLLGIDDDDDLEQLTGKARAHLTELGMSESGDLEALLGLVDVPTQDREWHLLDPVQKRRRCERTLQAILTAFCARGPVILLFEDLHWCDPDSLEFISKLVESPPGSHTLLLLTHRPELQRNWAELPHVLSCGIAGLDPANSEALLGSLLGAHENYAQLRVRLAARTVGNPFFIEESVRSVIDGGMLRELPSGVPAADGIDVPESIDALLGARVDRLSEPLLEVLQAAAVIGDDSMLELLRAVVDLSQPEFAQRLRALTEAELLYESVPLTASEEQSASLFRWKHALIQEVVYKRLVRSRKRALHGRVVDALEALFPARLTEHVARLAEHAQRAERWDKCAQYHTRACVHAASHSSNARAIAHLERGLEALGHMPEGEERDRLAIDLRLTALAPLLPLGAHVRVIQLLREAEQIARGLNDARRLAKVSSQLSAELWVTAQYELARREAEHSLSLAQQLSGDRFSLENSARYHIATIHHARGEFTPAIQILRELVSVFTGENARRRLGWAGYPSVMTRTFVISIQSMLGGFAEAARAFEEGRALANEFDHPFSRTMILEQYGMCLLVQAEAARAEELLREALEICNKDEVRTMLAPIASHLGLALLHQDRVSEAAQLLERAASEQAALAGHYALSYWAHGMSELQLRTGDIAGALQTAERAMQEAQDHGERAFYVRALLQHAAAVLRSPDGCADAVREYGRALKLAHQLGVQPWAALARQGLAQAHRLQGRLDLADEALASALAGWRELQAPARVAQVEALRAQYALPSVD